MSLLPPPPLFGGVCSNSGTLNETEPSEEKENVLHYSDYIYFGTQRGCKKKKKAAGERYEMF